MLRKKAPICGHWALAILVYYKFPWKKEETMQPVSEGLKSALEGIIATLSQREQDMARRYYGLMDCTCSSMEELGQIHNLSVARVRQVLAKLLCKLQLPSKATKLEMFVPQESPVQAARREMLQKKRLARILRS